MTTNEGTDDVDAGSASMHRALAPTGVDLTPLSGLLGGLRELGPAQWGTDDFDDGGEYMFWPTVEELLISDATDAHLPGPRVRICHAGHGANSYAFTVTVVTEAAVVVAQTGCWGVYGDHKSDTQELNRMLREVGAFVAYAPYLAASDERAVLLLSDIRDVSVSDVVDRGFADTGALRVWTDRHTTKQPLRARLVPHGTPLIARKAAEGKAYAIKRMAERKAAEEASAPADTVLHTAVKDSADDAVSDQVPKKLIAMGRPSQGESREEFTARFIKALRERALLPALSTTVPLEEVIVDYGTSATREAGWYPDPFGAAQVRWWEGRCWSRCVVVGSSVLLPPPASDFAVAHGALAKLPETHESAVLAEVTADLARRLLAALGGQELEPGMVDINDATYVQWGVTATGVQLELRAPVLDPDSGRSVHPFAERRLAQDGWTAPDDVLYVNHWRGLWDADDCRDAARSVVELLVEVLDCSLDELAGAFGIEPVDEREVSPADRTDFLHRQDAQRAINGLPPDAEKVWSDGEIAVAISNGF